MVHFNYLIQYELHFSHFSLHPAAATDEIINILWLGNQAKSKVYSLFHFRLNHTGSFEIFEILNFIEMVFNN
jgi:hypothetical protein